MALVRRYLRAIHYDKLVDGMMGSMLPVMAESTARSQPDLTATRQKLVVEVVREVMHDKMLPEMTERLVPIYAATFSESELQAIVTFYESPPGQAVVAKAPALAPQAASVLRSLMPEMQAEVMRRLCVRLNCNVDSRSLPKPS
jgi:hypothetical protein